MWRRRSSGWRQRALVIVTAAAALGSAHCGNAGPGGDALPPADLAICHAPAQVSGSPQTIEDVTALNTLVPGPLEARNARADAAVYLLECVGSSGMFWRGAAGRWAYVPRGWAAESVESTRSSNTAISCGPSRQNRALLPGSSRPMRKVSQ